MPTIENNSKVFKMLSNEAIKEFQELYHKEYGVQLSTDQASALAEQLLRLVKSVLTTSNQKAPTHEK